MKRLCHRFFKAFLNHFNPCSSDSGRAVRGNGRQEHRNEDEDEEGEIHPLVTLTKIDPNEIPEVDAGL